MECELPSLFIPTEFRVKQATQRWEFEQAYALRRAVFCMEQGIFTGDDRDALDADLVEDVADTPRTHDAGAVGAVEAVGAVNAFNDSRIHARLLVAVTCIAGMPDQVVGTVRIHQPEPRLWWGSRLAVHPSFRNHGGLGSTLIKLAVGTARAQGCVRFLAHVQTQNATLFERLHWRLLEDETLRGRPHCLMQAEVDWYAPCVEPRWGLSVAAARRPPVAVP